MPSATGSQGSSLTIPGLSFAESAGLVPRRDIISGIPMRKMLFCLAFCVGAHPVTATTILSVSGPTSGYVTPGLFPSTTLAFPFTVGQAYTGVSISVALTGTFSGTAYLTTQIGPSATASSQIATAPYSSSGPNAFQVVLQGISLSPGTYYVVLSTSQYTPPQGLATTISPVTTADYGASTPYGFYASASGNAFAPSDSFTLVALTDPGKVGGTPLMNITGTVSPPAILPGGVVPASGSGAAIQAGEWISIYGTNLANTTAAWNGSFQPYLAGVGVTINGKPAYPSFVSPTQINVQAPDDSATGPVPVVVTTTAGSATAVVTLAPAAPSFFLLDGKHVAGLILRSNGSGAFGGGAYDILGPTGSTLGYPTVAAKAGDSVVLFGTGFGPTSPAVPAGQTFSGAAPLSNTAKVTIGNLPVSPTFVGRSGAGLDQVNLVIPPGLATGDVALSLSVIGTSTPSGTVISLR
jgi:uncharacterized protein (TIGR03437 family)